MEYESNAMIVKVDTDDEYEFARDMQVICNCHDHAVEYIGAVGETLFSA